jgi:hypothetical protein
VKIDHCLSLALGLAALATAAFAEAPRSVPIPVPAPHSETEDITDAEVDLLLSVDEPARERILERILDRVIHKAGRTPPTAEPESKVTYVRVGPRPEPELTAVERHMRGRGPWSWNKYDPVTGKPTPRSETLKMLVEMGLEGIPLAEVMEELHPPEPKSETEDEFGLDIDLGF